MKVILLQDVARIGRRFEIKDVPDGHALNFLIPRKMAEPATLENVKRVTDRAKKQENEHAHAGEQFDNALRRLEAEAVVMKTEANGQGHLFKGIKPVDIAAYVNTLGITLHADQIELSRPIKEVGTHTIHVHLGAKKGSFELTIASV